MHLGRRLWGRNQAWNVDAKYGRQVGGRHDGDWLKFMLHLHKLTTLGEGFDAGF